MHRIRKGPLLFACVLLWSGSASARPGLEVEIAAEPGDSASFPLLSSITEQDGNQSIAEISKNAVPFGSIRSVPPANPSLWDEAPLADPAHLPFRHRFIHKIGAEFRPAYVVPTHYFLKGLDESGVPRRAPIDYSRSAHLKYAFQFRPNTYKDRISGSAYQGIGISYHHFYADDELGSPVSVYLLQGARIGRLYDRLSLHYEWNFGLAFGWKPFDSMTNPYNKVIGSEVNAYLNANFYFHYLLSRRIDLTAGIALAHFSNGSTRLPNAGLNTAGLTFGAAYHFNRTIDRYRKPAPLPGPAFVRHVSYEGVLFGSWRRRGVETPEGVFASPQVYKVAGGSFAVLYNLGYKIRIGAALDGVYDGSANIYAVGSGIPPDFETPSFGRQLALGVSTRTEYVMPYFTISLGFGVNALHGGGNLRCFYQLLALKIDVGKHSFVNIGYSLKEFKSPNYLMLGIGRRFNDKPQTYRR